MTAAEQRRRAIQAAAAAGHVPTIQAAGRVTAVTAAAGDRTIRGAFLPYGVVGYTSAGPTIVDAGALRVPADLSRVKLLVQHDQSVPAVGVMSEFTDGDTEAVGAWSLPEDDDATEALTKAGNGLRDGLSVGMMLLDYSWDDRDNLLVHEAELYEVSLVTIPAWTDARVAAARKELHDMPKIIPASEAPAPDVQAAGTAPTLTAESEQPAPVEQQAAPVVAGRQQPAQGLTLSAAASRTMQYLRDGGSLSGLSAALEDITIGGTTPTFDGADESHTRPAFIGEVWTASNTRRPLIEALGTPKPLTSVKVYGWKWVETPQVAAADLGSKEPIPSNTWSTTTVDSEAQDFAGGWDVARKLIDLGAEGIVEVAFSKATDDYRAKTEAWVVTSVLAEATDLGAHASVPAMLTAVGVAAAALGSSIDFVMFSPTVWADFTGLTEADVPWWLRSQGAISLGTTTGNAGGLSFASSPSITGRGFLAGDARAATYYEVDPPIRVRAENIPNGGVDLGVFGYAALIVNDPRAMFKGTVTAPVVTAPVVEAPAA